MKSREPNTHKALPKGSKIDPSLSEKYANSNLFKEKFAKNDELIRRIGLPGLRGKFERQNAILRNGNLPKFD
ncbi:hypothetical protein [Dyadobacter luticola]|uniref:hypothetical protein n=1 Tax=Dyadobacter luticola TaxID=1979387 RepID=UPI00197B03A2|nr:hypothetical protein [Dyadobacter luticola]